MRLSLLKPTAILLSVSLLTACEDVWSEEDRAAAPDPNHILAGMNLALAAIGSGNSSNYSGRSTAHTTIGLNENCQTYGGPQAC